MKAVLSSLMCLVLTISHSYALKGGPNSTGQRVRTTGNYAGLFVPSGSENSLGIFTTTIPRNGAATGTVALFRNGIFYSGMVQGIADPDSAVFTAVVNSSSDITFAGDIVGGVRQFFVVTFNANGSINGRIRPNRNVSSAATARIVGTAAVTFRTVGGDDPSANSDGPVAYLVNGFKQSEAP